MPALTRLSLWAPVLLWAGLIFTLSSVPDLSTGLGDWDRLVRKLAHAAEYAVLGALLLRAVGREPVALALGSLYAVTDEVHQSFVEGRHASPVDWAIDTAGVALGILVLSRATSLRSDEWPTGTTSTTASSTRSSSDSTGSATRSTSSTGAWTRPKRSSGSRTSSGP